MMQQARCAVDLGALRHNATVLGELVGPQARIAPVIKANAYGHGLTRVARSLDDLPCVWGFAVARGEEALLAREAGVVKPILTLGPPPVEGVAELAAHNITVGVGDPMDIASVRAQLEAVGREIDVHLKVNTGMCRMGVEVGDVAAIAAALDAGPLRLRGVYSHFADAENADLTFARQQLGAFGHALEALAGRDVLRHTANSPGLARLPESRYDLVRPGAILYGLNSGIPQSEFPDVRPALRLVARVAAVKRFEAGCCVGYGRRFRLERPSTIALVPVGYADGYPRPLSGTADVLVRGRRAPVVGAVNMDSITVDVTDLGQETAGEEAVLIGAQGDDRITVEELADRAETVVHEIPARLGPRLPRVYE